MNRTFIAAALFAFATSVSAACPSTTPYESLPADSGLRLFYPSTPLPGECPTAPPTGPSIALLPVAPAYPLAFFDADGTLVFQRYASIDFAGFVPAPRRVVQAGWVRVYVNGRPMLIQVYVGQ
jgi:hypothetical protein